MVVKSFILLILLLFFCKVASFNLYGNKPDHTVSKTRNINVKTKLKRMPVDHYDKNDKRKWTMRYLYNLQFWKPNSTLYIILGGANEVTGKILTSGFIYELAQKTNGAIFALEHRYYGKSMPFPNLENLRYLNSYQALADYNKLVKHIKSKRKHSKVVIVGSFYAGSLAVWLKAHFPDSADAVLASSAPLLAKKDFREFLEQVAIDYEQHANCTDKIRQIFKTYEETFQTEEGMKKLKLEENICEDNNMTITENKQTFFLHKVTQFMIRAQFGTPMQIKNHCESLNNTGNQSIGDSGPNFKFPSDRTDCHDYDFNSTIKAIRMIPSLTAWTYQTCTEFGFFPSTSSDSHPFTNNIPLQFYYKICSSVFGATLNESRLEDGISQNNLYYDALHPKVNNVIFINGAMDPWHRLGLKKGLSYNAPVIVVSKMSQSQELLPCNTNELQEISDAKEMVSYLIWKWLGFRPSSHFKNYVKIIKNLIV